MPRIPTISTAVLAASTFLAASTLLAPAASAALPAGPTAVAFAEPARTGPMAASARNVSPTCPRSTVRVRTAQELSAALKDARPGAVIALAPGSYRGRFRLDRSGSPAAPIWVCGPRTAVLDGGTVEKGYGLHLDRVHDVRIVGFTVRRAQKGIMADGLQHSVIASVDVQETGDEGIHLRRFSSDNLLLGNLVHRTGLRVPAYGEGIYIGSAHSNWRSLTGGRPDRSDRNVLRANTIRETTAEAVDIKEGTTGGAVLENRMDGSASRSVSCTINVKGNRWRVTGNAITHPASGAPVLVHREYRGWGIGNIVRADAPG